MKIYKQKNITDVFLALPKKGKRKRVFFILKCFSNFYYFIKMLVALLASLCLLYLILTWCFPITGKAVAILLPKTDGSSADFLKNWSDSTKTHEVLVTEGGIAELYKRDGTRWTGNSFRDGKKRQKLLRKDIFKAENFIAGDKLFLKLEVIAWCVSYDNKCCKVQNQKACLLSGIKHSNS